MASCVQVKPKEDELKKEISNVSRGSEKLEKLKTCNKNAFRLINEGLDLEDRGKAQNAIACYEKGLRIIESGLKSSNDLLGLYQDEATQYKEVLSKLTRAQKEIILRLQTLKEEDEMKAESPLPSAPPLNVSADKAALIPNIQGENVWQDVKELLNIQEGIKLFHVGGNGAVSPWTSSTAILQVFQILKENLEKIPPAFIKCGEWVYPLEPGKSPVLKTQHRTYMFPDVNMQVEEGTDVTQIPCIGLILADIVPDAAVKRFERILSCYGNFRKDLEEELDKHKTKPQRPPPPYSTAVIDESQEDVIKTVPGVREERGEEISWTDKVTSGINVGSQWISWGLLKGAEYTGTLVEKGAHSLRGRIKPNEVPKEVDPEISHNIRQLHQATGSVVQVSSFLVTALGALTVNIGKKLAPHVVEQGQKLIPAKHKPENSEATQKKIEDAKKVAIAGLQGLSIMFLALEQAGKNVYHTVSKATVQTMEHKYGEEVGDVTQDAMGAAGNAVKTVWNVKQLGPKAIAKRTLKDTGKAMIEMPEEGKEMKEVKYTK